MPLRFAREAEVLRALAHPARLEILEHLRLQPACVCHLTRALGRPQAYVSQQLAILRDAGLVEGMREGAFIYYRLRDYGVLGMIDFASRSLGRAPGAPTVPAGRLEGCECPRCAEAGALAKGSAG